MSAACYRFKIGQWAKRAWLRWRYVKVRGFGGHLVVDLRWYIKTGAWAQAMNAIKAMRR